MKRGPSAATVKAMDFLRKNPNASAREIAKKFSLDESTVYRAVWYKAHRAAQKAAQQ